jgi:hypothetical protein
MSGTIEVNVHLFDETSKNIISSTTVKLSPIESKFSLSAIRTGVIGIFKAHAKSSSSSGSAAAAVSNGDIFKKDIIEWPKTQEGISSNEYSSSGNVVVNTPSLHWQALMQYMGTLKNPDSLIFVQVQGLDVIASLNWYENWHCEDDSITTAEVVQAMETHRPMAAASDIAIGSGVSGGLSDNGGGPNETKAAASAPLSSSNVSASNGFICPTVDFCLAKGFLMPAPTLRVSIRASRTVTDLHGKSFTMYNIFVKQGSLVCLLITIEIIIIIMMTMMTMMIIPNNNIYLT